MKCQAHTLACAPLSSTVRRQEPSMMATHLKQRLRKGVTIYLGVTPLMFGGMYSPFAILGRYPNYALRSIVLVGIGTTALLAARISLDAPGLLARRIVGSFALGAASGYFIFEMVWAELLHSWYEYIVAFLTYGVACWCIAKFVDLRVDKWRHDKDLPSNTSLERTSDR
jgi:hypothetical protein